MPSMAHSTAHVDATKILMMVPYCVPEHYTQPFVPWDGHIDCNETLDFKAHMYRYAEVSA